MEHSAEIQILDSKFAMLKLEQNISKLEESFSKNASKVQSILFDVKKFNIAKSKAWLKSHGYVILKIHTTDQYHRFRQMEPKKGAMMRTITLAPGIKAIVMRDGASTSKQSKFKSQFASQIRLKRISKFAAMSAVKSDLDMPIPMQAQVRILKTGANRDGIIRKIDLENMVNSFEGLPIIDWHNMGDMTKATDFKVSEQKGFINAGSQRVIQDPMDPNTYWVVADMTITDRYLAYLAYLAEIQGRPLEVSAEYGWVPEFSGTSKFQTNIRPQLLTVTKHAEAHIKGAGLKITSNI